MRRRRLFESVVTQDTPADIDLEEGVIRGVKILGRKSRNGRIYSENALKQALELYEGIDVNVDHPEREKPDAERKMAEGFGVLRNVRRDGDGVYGDLYYLKSHPLVEMVLERAQKFPKNFGLSHNASGEVVRRNGVTIVETLEQVRSVDLVRNPATNDGLFESENKNMAILTVREVFESCRKNQKARASWQGKALARLLEMEDEEMQEMEDEEMAEMADEGETIADQPVEVEENDDPEVKMREAFKAAIIAAVDDDSLDFKGTLGKIKELLQSQMKTVGVPGEGDGGGETPVGDDTEVAEGEDEDGEDELPESYRKRAKRDPAIKHLLEEVSRMKRKERKRELVQHCTELLESADREVTESRLKVLRSLASDSDRAEAIREWPSKTAQKRPGSSAPLYESEKVGRYGFKNATELAESLR